MAANGTPQRRALAAWFAVVVLSLCYMFSFLDRQILVLLIEPIKADLGLSDTQVSLLSGLAFGLVYTIMGLPLGRLADLWIRKYVLIIGVTIWSGMTALAGLATSFTHLFVARMGVGLGEAALTPTSYAIIGDLFPPKRMALAMSVFTFGGIAVGVGMSLIVGGAVIKWVEAYGPFVVPSLGELAAWQVVLFAVGLLSMLMVVPLALIREPERSERTSGAKPMSFGQVLKYVGDNRDFYGPFAAAMCCAAFLTYGVGAWIPTYFIRIHGWEASNAGITLGGIYVIAATLGSLGAGVLSDRLSARGHFSAPLVIMALACVVGGLLVLALIYVMTMTGKLVGLAGLYLCIAINGSLFPTVLMLATRRQIRAQVSALNLLVINLVGLALGPVMIALITDYVFADEMMLGHSIAIVGVVSFLASGIGLFAVVPAFRRRQQLDSNGPECAGVDAGVVRANAGVSILAAESVGREHP